MTHGPTISGWTFRGWIVKGEWIAATLAACVYILATSALAQSAGGAPPAGISAGAFAESFAERGVYQKWDLDQDGIVDQREFAQGFHGYYDRDKNEILDEKEAQKFEKDVKHEGWDE